MTDVRLDELIKVGSDFIQQVARRLDSTQLIADGYLL